MAGAVYDDALAACREHAAGLGSARAPRVRPPADRRGPGHLRACELDEQAPGIDTVLVGVGGGGLCAGAAAWYGDRAKVVAVEPETSQAYRQAIEAGEPVEVEVGGVAADSLGAQAGGRDAVGDDARARRRVGAGQRRGDPRDAAAAVAPGADRRPSPAARRRWPRSTSGAYRPEAGERVAVVLVAATSTRPCWRNGSARRETEEADDEISEGESMSDTSRRDLRPSAPAASGSPR